MGACGTTCGINKERERERTRAVKAVERSFPGFVWRVLEEPSPSALPADGITELGRALEQVLPVRAIPRLAEVGSCDWLYLLAGLHEPALIEVADGTVPNGPDRKKGRVELRDEETYVRLGFSPIGRYVTIQEVLFTAEQLEEDALEILEAPKVGVEDRRLQAIVKGLQGALRKSKLVVLDMAFLVAPPPVDVAQDAFEVAFGGKPELWSFLFDAAPASTTRAHFIPRTAQGRRFAIASRENAGEQLTP
jgi:hypothetical protein